MDYNRTPSATLGVFNARTGTIEMHTVFGKAIEHRDCGDLAGYFSGIREVHRLNEGSVRDGLYDPGLVELVAALHAYRTRDLD